MWGVKWHLIFAKKWVGNDIHLGTYFATDIEKKQRSAEKRLIAS